MAGPGRAAGRRGRREPLGRAWPGSAGRGEQTRPGRACTPGKGGRARAVPTGRSPGRSGPVRLRGGAIGRAVPGRRTPAGAEPAASGYRRGRSASRARAAALSVGRRCGGGMRLSLGPAERVLQQLPACAARSTPRGGELLGGCQVLGYNNRLRHSGRSWVQTGGSRHLSSEEVAQKPARGIRPHSPPCLALVAVPQLRPRARFQLTAADMTRCR